MEIVSEPVQLRDVVVEAPDAEAPYAEAPDAPPAPEPAIDAKRTRAPGAKAEPKARARKPAPAPAPTPAPTSIEDVMGMLAAAITDQRQTRTAQRRELYRGFLE